jgi:deferrochelatase/peroxidase EfeB
MSDQIQEGVFFRPGEKPPDHFAIAFLKSKPGATPAQIDQVLTKLFSVYRELKEGKVPDLPGQSVCSGNLSVLLGFGSTLFSVSGLSKSLPAPFLNNNRFKKPSSGNSILDGAGLHYSSSVIDNPADADIVLQFHANTALAVNRGIVETWKVLHDLEKDGLAPLYIAGSYTGFGRDDHRSWIEFHDGVSNLISSERIKAIEIQRSNPNHPDAWTHKGTYMVFLRIPVNLTIWRSIPRLKQEELVGRDKLTGCSITKIDSSGVPSSRSGCPVTGTKTVVDKGNESFREAPRPSSDQKNLLVSHIHRANHANKDIENSGSRLIFRQGYEFFEGTNTEGQPRVGLNFVSFQDDPVRVTSILQQPGWLGDTNFGGDPNLLPPNFEKFLEVEAAGAFLVPPRDDELRFPGAMLFDVPASV